MVPDRRVRAGGWRTPLPWLAGLLVLYLALPLAAFLVRLGGAHGSDLAAPGLGAALAVSVGTATASTALIALVGIPLAYLLSRARGAPAGVLGVLVQLPLALPPLMSGILLVYVVGPYSPLGVLFGGRLTDSLTGIVLAQTFVAAPFLVVAARSAFAAVDPALADVAATLGHGRWSRFVRVALPAAGPGLRAGLLLAWLRAFGEFGATVVLAYHPYSLPVYTYVQFGGTGLATTLVPVAVALLAALLVLVASNHLPALRRPRRAVRLPAPRPPAARPSPVLSFELSARLGGFTLRAGHPPAGRQLAVLGPSGAGKSMMLRVLAGLLRPGSGRVLLDGRDITALPAERRGVGYLPQDPALLPGLPVAAQVTFGVGADPAVAAYWLDRLGLAGLAERRPDQLSGGQRRRVALARALARQPDLLLLDEPFAGLDTPVRDDLRWELRRLQRDAGLATVIVTHDPDEAALLADHVLLLAGGRVIQQGPQPAVYARPADPAVARLLGIRNVNPGVLLAGGVLVAGGDPAGAVRIGPLDTDLPAGARVAWCVRPDRARLVDAAGGTTGPAGTGAPAAAGLPATVLDVVRLGACTEVVVELAPAVRWTVQAAGPVPAVGDRCRLEVPPDAVVLWPAERTSG